MEKRLIKPKKKKKKNLVVTDWGFPNCRKRQSCLLGCLRVASTEGMGGDYKSPLITFDI